MKALLVFLLWAMAYGNYPGILISIPFPGILAQRAPGHHRLLNGLSGLGSDNPDWDIYFADNEWQTKYFVHFAPKRVIKLHKYFRCDLVLCLPAARIARSQRYNPSQLNGS